MNISLIANVVLYSGRNIISYKTEYDTELSASHRSSDNFGSIHLPQCVRS